MLPLVLAYPEINELAHTTHNSTQKKKKKNQIERKIESRVGYNNTKIRSYFYKGCCQGSSKTLTTRKIQW